MNITKEALNKILEPRGLVARYHFEENFEYQDTVAALFPENKILITSPDVGKFMRIKTSEEEVSVCRQGCLEFLSEEGDPISDCINFEEDLTLFDPKTCIIFIAKKEENENTTNGIIIDAIMEVIKKHNTTPQKDSPKEAVKTIKGVIKKSNFEPSTTKLFKF